MKTSVWPLKKSRNLKYLHPCYPINLKHPSLIIQPCCKACRPHRTCPEVDGKWVPVDAAVRVLHLGLDVGPVGGEAAGAVAAGNKQVTYRAVLLSAQGNICTTFLCSGHLCIVGNLSTVKLESFTCH